MSDDFHDETTVTARKPHHCEERGCRRGNPIKPGDRYVRVAGKWGGDFYAVVLCARCARLRKKVWTWFNIRYGDEGPALGELLGWVLDTRLYAGPRQRTGKPRWQGVLA